MLDTNVVASAMLWGGSYQEENAMASTKVIEAKLDRLSGEITALRLEVLSKKAPRQKTAEDLKASWRRLGRKVSRRWKTGTAAEEIAAQRTKDA